MAPTRRGIWEVRGPRRHFTHSKVMAWVAFDRAVEAVERYGADGPVDRWRQLRAEVHVEVCDKGFDPRRNTFTQYYGSEDLDASLLMIPLVGFLPATDPRIAWTMSKISATACARKLRCYFRQLGDRDDSVWVARGAAR